MCVASCSCQSSTRPRSESFPKHPSRPATVSPWFLTRSALFCPIFTKNARSYAKGKDLLINSPVLPNPWYSFFQAELGEALARPTKIVFQTFLKKRLGKRGVASRLAKFCDVTEATVSRWKSGESEPSFDTLDKIARFFEKEAGSEIIRDGSDPKTSGVTFQKAYEILGSLIPKDS